ncbi:MAG: hypothetical protein KDK97_02430 [Verrucomicrobiales bacterium]|nr:hypothetical protein [Verrucomicrobiales bacterium]MCP5556896.1 sialate O-acetylesterase [Verrucomicrobiaceae bacterium]
MAHLSFSSRLLAIALLTAPLTSQAALSLPHFFSDHMVLQRDTPAAIWGSADAGATVKISFKGQTAAATADAQGHWKAAIPTGAADAAGAELTIQSGDQTMSIKDVLVGEVWFASGQSNMVFTLNRVPAYKAITDATNDPQLRFFLAPLVTSDQPETDIEGHWDLATPETTPGFSAVAFFFAKKLREELKVPVGVIKSAWGGKPVETFTSRDALVTIREGKAMVDEVMAREAAYNQERADKAYAEALAKWTEIVKAARGKPENERGRLPKRPAPPKRPLLTEGVAGVLYDAMIHPFVGYTIKGAIWYQGEGNAKVGAIPYDKTLPLMITDWRKRWGSEFSFYFVQLANYHAPSTEPGTPDPWPLVQDRMRRVLDSTPKTGMAVINDVGEANNIHPADKQTVGDRLARWALVKDYGKDMVVCGPLYRSHEIDGAKIRIKFDNATGLKSRDGGPLKRFEISGKERTWHWADAVIDGDSVVVSSAAVPVPAAVRYAWAANPEGANLVNGEGLPASVFRTDDWKDVDPQPDPTIQTAQQKRNALRDEIKRLAAERAKLDPKSEEFKTLSLKIRDMLTEYKAGQPAGSNASKGKAKAAAPAK